ncbi:67_t:CDS:2, partial [Scutellospora calospora]
MKSIKSKETKKEKNIYDLLQTSFTIAINTKKYRDNILNKDSISENKTSSNNIISLDSLAKNITTTSKITNLTSLTEYHITSNIAEAYTFEKTYILDYSLLESLEEPCANYRSYSNTHSAYEFISAIRRVIEEAICQEIQKSLIWSIIINKSNTITTTKNIAIVSKHISNNFSVYCYLGMIELKERTANAIINELNIFLQTKNLLIDYLMNIGSDSASVILGCNNSVATQFKKKSIPYGISLYFSSFSIS